MALEKERQILPMRPGSGTTLSERDAAQKKVHPLPPSGSKGEHFGYSTKSYRHYHLQLRDFDRKQKAKQSLQNPSLFVTF
jgi:hypothetical protein